MEMQNDKVYVGSSSSTLKADYFRHKDRKVGSRRKEEATLYIR
jgi:hypothetical protein